MTYLVIKNNAFDIGTKFVGYYKEIKTVTDLLCFYDAFREFIVEYEKNVNSTDEITILSYQLLKNK